MASLAGAVWQIANPVPAFAELYASDPALAHACVDLVPRLRRTADINGGMPRLGHDRPLFKPPMLASSGRLTVAAAGRAFTGIPARA